MEDFLKNGGRKIIFMEDVNYFSVEDVLFWRTLTFFPKTIKKKLQSKRKVADLTQRIAARMV